MHAHLFAGLAEKFGSSPERVPEVTLPVYIWKGFGDVDYLSDFQLNEFMTKTDCSAVLVDLSLVITAFIPSGLVVISKDWSFISMGIHGNFLLFICSNMVKTSKKWHDLIYIQLKVWLEKVIFI